MQPWFPPFFRLLLIVFKLRVNSLLCIWIRNFIVCFKLCNRLNSKLLFFWQISKVALFWQIFKVALFWQIFKVDLFWQIFKVALFWQIFKLVLKVKYKQLFLLQCNQLFQADIINNFHQVTRWSRNWSTDFGTDRETWSTTVKFIDTNWSTHRFPSTKEGFWVDRQKSLPW